MRLLQSLIKESGRFYRDTKQPVNVGGVSKSITG